MQFRQSASVYTFNGKEVGRIERVVLDPTTKAVTHLVIRQGILFKEDKVVPVELIGQASEKGIQLRVGDLTALPVFEETHYILASENEARPAEAEIYPLFLYPAPGSAALLQPMAPPPYVAQTEQHIPEGTVALKEGAKVIAADGKNVGTLEQVLTEPGQDRAAYLIIAQGLLLKERRRIPSTWISDISEDEIRLSVAAHTLEELGFVPA